MRTVFADSFFFFALVNPSDPTHAKATAFAQNYNGRTVTTAWVVTELADGCARPPARRAVFLQMLADLRANPDISIIPYSERLMQEAIDLYARRSDKEWSLTDCASFVVMTQERIREALTGDHHFEQAGFVALLN